jgi:choline-sulfatase
VRTRDWKYTQYPNILDLEELYHLAEDPHELNNLAGDPTARGKLGELRAELESLTREIS